jgi:hypothetical protein
MAEFFAATTISDIAQFVTAAVVVFSAVVGLMTARAVRTVHVLMNSRLTELLEARTGEARAEGVNAGRSEARAEIKPENPDRR